MMLLFKNKFNIKHSHKFYLKNLIFEKLKLISNDVKLNQFWIVVIFFFL